MRKVNKRSRQLRHHNSGANTNSYFSRIKEFIRNIFSRSSKSFTIDHREDRYEGYSLPNKQPRAGQYVRLNLIKKYVTHAGLIAVAGFTILSNSCFGQYCNEYSQGDNIALASANRERKDIIEIDVSAGESTSQVVDSAEIDQIASTLAKYTASDSKKELIDRTIQEKNHQDDSDFAIIQNSFLDKVNSPVTTVSDAPRQNVIMHIVKGEETLWSIADKYQISTDTVRWSNGMDDSGIIIEGQELSIMPVNGIYYTVSDGDSISSISEKYKSDLDDIRKWNDFDTEDLSIGQKIILPGGKVPPPPKPQVPVYTTPTNNYTYNYQPDSVSTAPPGGSGSGQFGWPTAGMTITQYFGSTSFNPWHTGIDIDSRSGWDIYASDGGTVVTSVYGWGGGYGNHVIIDHGNGYQTMYAHLSSPDVSAGQYVSKGQRIGTMGSTGWSTG
ncbi:M23 family metallopeptidase, partial [Patescibacteria group bacterium]|nr:M23 family metallopeptidase [Patescibacteria group bacterium]